MNAINSPSEDFSHARKYRSLLSVVVVLAIGFCFTFGVVSRLRLAEKNAGGLGKVIPYHELSARLPDTGMVDVGGGKNEMGPVEIMYDALRQLRQFYVERIEDTQERDLTHGSLRKMLESLADPHSRFLLPEQRELVDDAHRGKFHGIGAAFGMKRETTDDGVEMRLVVIAPLAGSSAEKAGLKPGDVITEVDGKWLIHDPNTAWTSMVKGVRNGQIEPAELEKALMAARKKMEEGITVQKAADKLANRSTDKFEITIRRDGSADPIKLTIAAEDIETPSVEHRQINPTTGYIRINYFGQATADAFANALTDLRGKKATRLVVDLRNSPGGSVDSALRVAGWLIPGKRYAQLVKARNARESVNAPAPGKNVSDKAKALAIAQSFPKPIVVLVNRGTAGAAETLAAALQDNGSATLVGTTSYGDFLQHTLFVLRDGSAVTFTTGKYLTPKGTDLNQKGLQVDIAAPQSAKGDAQLEKALTAFKTKAGA